MVNLKPTKIIKISPKDFDPRGNIEMTGYKGKRGGEDYQQPPKGWVRIGLKVSGLFDDGNDDWLGTDENAWPVAYHGTGNYDFVVP
jgi:hypothetical protein